MKSLSVEGKEKREILAKSPLQVKMDSDGGADGRSRETYEGEASDEGGGLDEGEEGSRGRGQLALVVGVVVVVGGREKAVTRIRGSTTALLVV